MPAGGLEPPRLSAADFKSAATTVTLGGRSIWLMREAPGDVQGPAKLVSLVFRRADALWAQQRELSIPPASGWRAAAREWRPEGGTDPVGIS